MALWIMGFGGTVPFGGLLGGLAMEKVGIEPVILAGVVVSLLLSWWADLQSVSPRQQKSHHALQTG